MSYGKNNADIVAEFAALEAGGDYQDRFLELLDTEVGLLRGNPYEALALVLDVLPDAIVKAGGPVELSIDRVQDIVYGFASKLAPALSRRLLKLVETFYMEGDLKTVGEVSIFLVISLVNSRGLDGDKLRIFRRFLTRSGDLDWNTLNILVAETVNAMMDMELPPEEIYAFIEPYKDLDAVRDELDMRGWPLDIEEARKLPGGLKSLSCYMQML